MRVKYTWFFLCYLKNYTRNSITRGHHYSLILLVVFLGLRRIAMTFNTVTCCYGLFSLTYIKQNSILKITRFWDMFSFTGN
jgi:hypothetical protein